MRPNAPVSAVPGIESEKKVGIALVGIGSLTTGQLIPALRSITKYCKCVAFVTGHRENNLPPGMRMGITPEHVYTYDNFDTIKDNPGSGRGICRAAEFDAYGIHDSRREGGQTRVM